MEQQKSRAISPEHRHRVGMRIIKTVVAVFLCGVLAFLRDKSALYSMFAALFCVQNSTGKTFHSSIDRALGTLIGGVVGVLTVYAMDTLNVLHIDLLRYLLMSLLLIPVIELCLAIKKPGCAGMACMVVMCLVVDPGDKPAVASIERLFETVVGVVLASGIDVLLPYQPVPQPAGKENEAPRVQEQPEAPPVQPQEETPPIQTRSGTPPFQIRPEIPPAQTGLSQNGGEGDK